MAAFRLRPEHRGCAPKASAGGVQVPPPELIEDIISRLPLGDHAGDEERESETDDG